VGEMLCKKEEIKVKKPLFNYRKMFNFKLPLYLFSRIPQIDRRSFQLII